MKVAIVTASYPFGPGEAFFDAEVHAMVGAVDDIVLIPTCPETLTPTFTDVPAKVFREPRWSAAIMARALSYAFRHPRASFVALSRLLGAPCALTTKLRYLRYFPKALSFADIVQREGVTHVHAYWLSEPAFIARTISVVTGISWSCTAHRVDISNNDLYPRYFTDGSRAPTFVRAISQHGRADILAAAPQAADRLVMLHVGVDIPATVAPPRERKELVVLCAAFFEERKGHRYLLEAIAKLRRDDVPVRCVLAGDGPIRRDLEALIASLGIRDAVSMRGTVSHDTLLAEMRSGEYDVMVLASCEVASAVSGEGIPVSLMEAMAAGIVCVSTPIGGIPELITAGSGMIVPPHDHTGMAEALSLLAGNPQVRRSLAARGRERIVEEFSSTACGLRLAELIVGASRLQEPDAHIVQEEAGGRRAERLSSSRGDAKWRTL